jgi:hypothetical protein
MQTLVLISPFIFVIMYNHTDGKKVDALSLYLSSDVAANYVGVGGIQMGFFTRDLRRELENLSISLANRVERTWMSARG